jgi:hypothetical protein
MATYRGTRLAGMSQGALKNIVTSLGEAVKGYEIRNNVLYIAYINEAGDVVPLCYEASPDGGSYRELAPYEIGDIDEWPSFVTSKLTQ